MTTATFPHGSKGQPGFVMLGIPFLQAAVEKGLSDLGFRVYATLMSHKNRLTGLCFPTAARIAALVGKSERSVRKVIAELVDLGFLLIERSRRPSGRYGVNLYKLMTPDNEEITIEFDAPEDDPADAIECATPEAEDAMNPSALAGLQKLKKLAEAKENAVAKADDSALKKLLKKEKLASADMTPAVAEAQENAALAAAHDEHAPKKTLNSNDVRAWFEESQKTWWPALKFLPVWTMKDKAIAKRLLEHYDEPVLRKMIDHAWRNRVALRCNLPTPAFLWAVQSRVFGDVSAGEASGPTIGNETTHTLNMSVTPGKAAALKKGEYDASQSLTGGKGGVVSMGEVLKQMGID